MVAFLYPAFFITALLLCVYRYSSTIQKQEKRIITRYILLKTGPSLAPLRFLRHAFDAFISNDCEYTNCYVSYNVSDLGGVVYFDAIVFNGRQLPKARPRLRRSPKQKYVYANMESSQNFPIYNTRLNSFFNWTWTYKLDSDLRWGYFTVYNLAGQVVGPKKEMHWQEMDPIDVQTMTRLSSKSVAAVWFASNCYTLSNREEFVKVLVRELHRYGLLLHIYGACGHKRHGVCPRGNPECDKVLEQKYYFYLAFENSLSEDYVTKKVLTALNHYTVPVVFGGANYSRFLPPGSYLDARELGAKRLAARMAAIINDHKKSNGSLYFDFFRWRNHYTYKATHRKEDVCNICKLLNDPVALTKTTGYENFRDWWNG
ncbi:alpha-(1,3)-fucosyltransferase C-like [Cydia pomonella]|uniref:alpha-(1,3)-fucosyltransferase C-like n=1 Tax=Cydia pomonella TaxID=82600 RepID=UPI002ADE7155|nr:alpha-(1,3)-fucosyltransferase C-like [Cydia pomonella]